MSDTLELRSPAGTFVVQPSDTVVVGTAADCAVVVPSGPGGPRPHHVRIRRVGREWTVFDLGTGSPTFVDGVAVSTSQVLRGAGTLQLGVPPAQVTVSFQVAGRAGGVKGGVPVWKSPRVLAAAVVVVAVAAVGWLAFGRESSENLVSAPRVTSGATTTAVGVSDTTTATTAPSTTEPPTETTIATTAAPETTVTAPPTTAAPGTLSCSAQAARQRAESGVEVGFVVPRLSFVDADGAVISDLATPATHVWAANFWMLSDPYRAPRQMAASTDADAAVELVQLIDAEWVLRRTNSNYVTHGPVLFVVVGEPGSYTALPTSTYVSRVVVDPQTGRIQNDPAAQLLAFRQWEQDLIAECAAGWQELVAWGYRTTWDTDELGTSCVTTIVWQPSGGVPSYQVDTRYVATGDYVIDASKPECVISATPQVVLKDI